MKPVCVPCQRFYRPKTNGFYFIEGMPIGDRVKPGLEEPERWKAYKLWMGDLWECKGCGAQIVVGVSGAPISEHYMPDFWRWVERTEAKLRVNDC